MSKIFIVEDDENIRNLIIYALKSSEFDCFGFENAEEFYNGLKEETPDLILLDIMLPDIDGISILKNIRQNLAINNVPVIMLTAKTSEYDKINGFEQGADDYISKPFSVLELISRIKAVLRRTNQKSNDAILSFKNIVLDDKKHIVTVDDVEVSLTLKEFDLLNLLFKNKGYVLSREKILEKVWGIDYEGETRTVDMHIKTLRQKLKDKGQLIETIRGVGYKVGE